VPRLSAVRLQGAAPAEAALFDVEADCCESVKELLAQLDIDDKEQALRR